MWAVVLRTLTRDILMGLIIEQMASGITNLDEQHRIRKATLEMLEKKAGELLARLPAKQAHALLQTVRE
jgi:hypothetical protein